MDRIVLNCQHVSTCLSSFWGGHHAAHIQVPVSRDTTMKELRQMLHSELNEGVVAGSDDRTRYDSGDIGDAWYKAAHAAINRDVRLVNHDVRLVKRGKPFGKLEPESEDDCCESVYAFFVFTDK